MYYNIPILNVLNLSTLQDCSYNVLCGSYADSFSFLTKQRHHNHLSVRFWGKQDTVWSNQPTFDQDVIELIAFHLYCTIFHGPLECQTANFAKRKKELKSNGRDVVIIEQAHLQYYIKSPNQTFRKIKVCEDRTIFVISSSKSNNLSSISQIQIQAMSLFLQ